MTTYPTSGHGAVAYVSPLWKTLTRAEARNRAIAYDLKSCPPSAHSLRVAVAAMAPLVPECSALVPIPASNGSLCANLALAEGIAGVVRGAQVNPALGQRRRRESSRLRRMTSQPPLSPADLLFVKRADIPPGWNIVFVDNVMTSGTTFEAARRALGRGRGLAFAQVAERHLEIAGSDLP